MATSLVEIEGFLINQELRHKVDEERDCIMTGFSMENYLDSDGDHHLQIVIKLEESGEFIKVFTPSCYQYSGPNQGVLFQVLLMVSWKTKMIQFEYDHSDGEVRAVVEFPLEDSILTEKQLMRAVVSLAQIIDRYNQTIETAMTEGIVTFDDNEEGQMMELLQQMLSAAQDVSENETPDGDDDDDDDMEFI